ncbi:YbjQ family protein [Desulfovibrio oxyclinae]|jgi:uncharacterized protein YbjQ (UPF0145 family)|uniref:YbjQ family protein n=1 Tax=Desulfovibrio oxyclinae TaxID=63560 RepID=UPI0003798301|nr:YbjQ family protein [Desulfovibrio oxyclinae]
MLLSNVETIPGKRIVRHHGMVTGSTVRARFFLIDLWQWIKGFFGGELKGYSKLIGDTRQQALKRMEEQAERLGANAVVNVRFATSTVSLGSSELYVYGTAVEVVDA